MSTDTVPMEEGAMAHQGAHTTREILALVICWMVDAPERVGEVFIFPTDAPDRHFLVGRGGDPGENPQQERVFPCRQRPGQRASTGPLRTPTLSREQLHIRVDGAGGLLVHNAGRCALRHNGQEVNQARVMAGDVLEVQDQLLLYLTRRTEHLTAPPDLSFPPFGEADAFGLVGESQALWDLRQQLLFVARRQGHVLIQGASGSGKELVARAIHQFSHRADKQLVARNAATLPEGLIDAELFGNCRNYPQTGMPERPGIIGASHGSTLFLDELGELPQTLQTHLLRVLDHGEYQRLGETTPRSSDFRLIGATNRQETDLKHDLVARLSLRIHVPGLNERPEDCPLLIRHLLKRILAQDPALAQRTFGGGSPRVSIRMVRECLQHPWTTHVRELELLLWRSLAEARSGVLDLPSATPTPITPRPIPRKEPSSTPQPPHPRWVNSLNPTEQLLLGIARRHHFNITAMSRDPHCPVQRVATDVHVRILMFKALEWADLKIDDATMLLAGHTDKLLQSRIQTRLETTLITLRNRATKEERPTLIRRLSKVYGGAMPTVLKMLDALDHHHIPLPGELADPTAIADEEPTF